MTKSKLIKLSKADLPEGWCVSTIGEISLYLQRGKSPKYAERSNLPVVNQKCVRWSGIDKTHLKYIHPEQFSQWASERYLVNGDILWNSTGTGTIGSINLKGKYLFGQTGEAPDIEYLMASISEYVPLSEK